MWLPIVGLLVGILLGSLYSVEIPLGIVKYTAIAILAAIDTILVFVSGFFANTFFAALLTAIGDLLGVDIYLGALIAFSIRIFGNVGFIRRDLVEGYWRATDRRQRTPVAGGQQ
ncbi:MAG: small basic family protein [Armatimonadetes bacterium]|nr:small basic family protein [Armatimonadota bacterium]